jgi:putative Mg2+ transporter-C (MgtC) family protein
MTAAIGVTIGLGSLGLALLGTVLALIVLTLVGKLEIQVKNSHPAADKKDAD